MIRLRSLLILLGLAAACGVASAQAEWRPAQPAVKLGLPQSRSAPAPIALAAANEPLSSEDLGVYRRHLELHTVFKAQPPGPPPGGFAGGSAEEQYNCGVIAEGPMPPPSALEGPRSFWDRCFGTSPNCGADTGQPWMAGPQAGPMTSPLSSYSFRSDHDFDYMISPVTNPFFFEDPRSLTELRPIFIFEKTASGNPATYGGSAYAFTLQGRLALNERWSIVIKRLGFTHIGVNDPPTGQPASPFTGGTAFSDIQIGPKWTFYRDPQSGTVAALGVDFEIPTGSNKVFQGEGFAITPYISAAQKLGDFNLMGSGGYRFGASGDRADMLFVSGHLDYNIANKFFPLVEVNWFHYTSSGNAFPGTFEGADLFNTGASGAKGRDLVTVALGARYKFSEAFQLGAAYEIPVVGKDDFYKWRVTVDMIFRY